jgi:DNA-binding SARP family transcriptional activator
MTLHEWAAAHLFRAAEYIAAKDLPGAPVAVELSPEGIEVLWDEPNMTCLDPFRVIDSGWSWQAAYDVDADPPGTPTEVVAPALVTLGIREGRSLMVDLEAFGAITVTGDPHAADALVRSIALELATGEQLSNAYVSLVGFHLGLQRHLPRAEVRNEAEAFRHLAEMSRMQAEVLADGEMRSTFHLRGASPAGREASVVVVRADECAVLPALLKLATPRSGVVVIVLSDTALTETVVEVDGAARGRLAQLGLEFDAVQLESETVDELATVIEAIEEPADDDLDVVATSFDLPEPTPAVIPVMVRTEMHDGDRAATEDQADAQGRLELVEGEADPTVEVDAWPRPDLLVRVLGRPRVEHEAKLSQLETSLVAYLACRGGSVPTEDVIDAVWKGALIDRRTMFNRLSKIRPKLGGVIAPIAKTDSTVRLEGVVVTDLQLLQDFAARAKGESSGEAMQLLRAGLELVEGPPFDGPMYEWAYTLQLHSAALTLIRESALALVDLALDCGDFKLARTAVAAGLRSARLSDELYQARMRVEAAAGNPAGVREAYNELVLLLDELDGGYEPHEDTQRLLADLVAKRLSA